MAGGIYVASKSKWGPMWIAFRTEYPIISTWIDEWSKAQTKDWSELWTRGIEEVHGCDAMVVYLGTTDVPRGGLYVEMGAALAFNKPVFFVGDTSVCSVFAHPNIVICDSVPNALQKAVVHTHTAKSHSLCLYDFWCMQCKKKAIVEEAGDGGRWQKGPPGWYVSELFPPGDDGLHYCCSKECVTEYDRSEDR